MHESPAEMLTTYVRAFEARDVQAVAAFYRLPCTFIRPDGVWVVSDDATAEAVAAHLTDHARSQGHVRTEVRDLRVRRLADGLATMTGVFVRYDEGDTEVGRSGFTYVVRHDGRRWGIAVAVAHDATPAEE